MSWTNNFLGLFFWFNTKKEFKCLTGTVKLYPDRIVVNNHHQGAIENDHIFLITWRSPFVMENVDINILGRIDIHFGTTKKKLKKEVIVFDAELEPKMRELWNILTKRSPNVLDQEELIKEFEEKHAPLPEDIL